LDLNDDIHGIFAGGPCHDTAKIGHYTLLKMFGYFPVEMVGYSPKGITGGLTLLGYTGALTRLSPRTCSDGHRYGRHP